MIRLFDTEDLNPQEYKGMKVGDVICTYNAGFHILDKIVRRFCSQEHYDAYYKNKPDDAQNKLNVGDEYSPNFRYTKIDPDTCKLGRKGECDAHYCTPGIPSLEEQISRLQRQKNRLKEYRVPKQKNIEIVNQENGLRCDNKNCDWADNTIKETDMLKWIDMPCPKCGENVLTKHDYDLHQKLMASIDFINTLDEEQIAKLNATCTPEKMRELFNNPDDLEKLLKGGEFNVSVSMHKEIKIDIKETE